LTGAGVEYTRGVAREAGFDTVEFRVFPNWDQALQAVYAGDVDAVFSANWSIERTRFLDFVRPAMSSQFLNVVVRRGEGFPLNKFEDLIGRTGANSQGETYGEGMFSQFASERLNLHKAPSMSQVFDLLLQKQVDYILAFENTVYEQMMTRNLGSTVQILNTYPTQLEGFIAFSKRSKCSEAVRVKFSEAIARANSRKTYRLLMHKYREVFNESLTRPK
jgi:polar amino acid transport system substrate-binding protein